MKRIRQLHESLTHEEKEKPREQQSHNTLRSARETGQGAAPGRLGHSPVPQTCGTQHTVFVFRDAFAAEELAAFRATRDSLAHLVVETTLG